MPRSFLVRMHIKQHKRERKIRNGLLRTAFDSNNAQNVQTVETTPATDFYSTPVTYRDDLAAAGVYCRYPELAALPTAPVPLTPLMMAASAGGFNSPSFGHHKVNDSSSPSPPATDPAYSSSSPSPGDRKDHSNKGLSGIWDARHRNRYVCPVPNCGKAYSSFSGLSKHKQNYCGQVKKSFPCKQCEKIYSSLGALKMHVRSHTLPCRCQICGKSFSRMWLLQGHIRIHTGEKPFSCQDCGRSFADRSNLRAHLQTHSQVKKYTCRNCSKSFSRVSLVKKHEEAGCCLQN